MAAPRSANVVRLGFVPLIDCASLVVAREMGFADQRGLTLELHKDMSWAAIRDKVTFGLYDGAHMLAGIPLATRLGLGGVKARMVAPMALGYGGNAVTVSKALYERMAEADPEAMAVQGAGTARALAKVIAADRSRGADPYQFATVFPFSTHNYELRYWLASAGIDPDRDLNLGIVAPPRMADALRSGWIDGYCVGEPWNLRSVAGGAGRIVATKDDIWPTGPEKVLGLSEEWTLRNPDQTARLVDALVDAAEWADDPSNAKTLAQLLARTDYVDADEAIIAQALSEKRYTFFRHGATYPWRAHGAWLLSQMVRWGQITRGADLLAVTEAVYRPDLYREAVADSVDLPAEEPRMVGYNAIPYDIPGASGRAFAMAPDRFLDGRPFDREDPAGYAFQFQIGHPAVRRADLSG
ncbi:MAG: CmpA/NrtA family ABC transporter substrate-binding protein [Rhodospirillaceae bacterium]